MNRNDYCFVGFSEVTCDITYNEELEIINKELGGTTFNILSNISRLSPKVQCYALGIFGEGKESLNMIHQLERAGVNAKYLRQVNKGLNVFHCIIPNDLSDINPTSGMLRDSITYSKISPITGESTYDRSCPINQEIPNELSNKPVIVILENFRDGTIPFLDSISSVQRKIIMDIGRIGIFQDLRKERIIELLKKNYIEKCQNSSIYNQIKEKLIKNLVLVDKEIINGYEKNLNIGEYLISKYLFTNIDLVNILNSMGIRSAYEDTYSIINEFNRALPIRWNDKNQRYTVEKKLEMHPVCGISWDGALMISKLFNGDLPNEIEWEIAASSGHKDYKYTWGNQSPSKEYANYEENIGRTTQVGMYNPNEIGLYDMNGNLEEWCKDNILGRQISKYERIIKGGCWYKPSNFMEIASYRARWNKLAGVGIGFRIKFNKGVIENEKGYNI